MSKYSVEIELDETRNLTLDFLAVSRIDAELQKSYGKTFFGVLMDFQVMNFNIDIINTILYYGLKREDTKLTKGKLLDLLTEAFAEKKLKILDLVNIINDAAIKGGIVQVGADADDSEESGETKDGPLDSTNGSEAIKKSGSEN